MSLIELIARPNDFEGKRISVSGTLEVRFELSALFLTKEDAERGNVANAVWITLPDSRNLRPEALTGSYVNVIGTFTAKENGHQDMFIGTIQAEAVIPYSKAPPN